MKCGELDFSNFLESFMEMETRELNIREILSKAYSEDVVHDVYDYCMRKCDWNPFVLEDGNVKDFLLCMLFQNEVDNGGICQFFFNSSGDLSSETKAALKRIDPEAAGVLHKAINCFPDGVVPEDREIRNNLMDQFDEETAERLESLDGELFAHNRTKLCYDFLQAHKEDFLKL